MCTMEEEEFMRIWNTPKIQKRISIPKELLEFINNEAFKDYGITQSSFSKEVCKLILIARENTK